MRQLQQFVQTIATQTLGRQFVAISQLLKYWPDLAATPLTKQCTPVAIRQMPSGKNRQLLTLVLRAPRGLLPALQYETAALQARLASFLGTPDLKLVFEPASLPSEPPATPMATRTTAPTPPAPPLPASLATMPELAAALTSLGQTLANQPPDNPQIRHDKP